MTGFEPAAFPIESGRATGLRYISKLFVGKFIVQIIEL